MSLQPPVPGRANGVPVPQLVTLRKRLGLSQHTLAERAGVSMQTISRLEHGANGRYATIALLAEALRVPPARLLKLPRCTRPDAPPRSVHSTRD